MRRELLARHCWEQNGRGRRRRDQRRRGGGRRDSYSKRTRNPTTVSRSISAEMHVHCRAVGLFLCRFGSNRACGAPACPRPLPETFGATPGGTTSRGARRRRRPGVLPMHDPLASEPRDVLPRMGHVSSISPHPGRPSGRHAGVHCQRRCRARQTNADRTLPPPGALLYARSTFISSRRAVHSFQLASHLGRH